MPKDSDLRQNDVNEIFEMVSRYSEFRRDFLEYSARMFKEENSIIYHGGCDLPLAYAPARRLFLFFRQWQPHVNDENSFHLVCESEGFGLLAFAAPAD